MVVIPAILPDLAVDRILASRTKGDASAVFDAPSRALEACLRIRKRDTKDGSNRLLAITCRGVGFNLSDDEVVSLVRQVEAEKPLPRKFSNAEIITRIRDAEKRVKRGCELVTKPALNVTTIDLSQTTAWLWPRIKEKNNPAFLFRFAGLPSRIEISDHGEPQIRAATFDVIRHHLADMFHFMKRRPSDGVEYPCPPPEPVVRDLLATQNIPLPIITRVVSAPVFAPDGTLITAAGYHAGAQTYYKPVAGV